MKSIIRSGLAGIGAIALAGAFAGVAGADTSAQAADPSHVLFVQTDNPSGNRVDVYNRAPNGTLSAVNSYATGGLGGVLNTSIVDHLASQGSLTYNPFDNQLYALNAGSDTVSVFSAFGDQLALKQVIPSGGTFPVSVTVHGDVVYVLNALNGGSVQGYTSSAFGLAPLPGSNRALGLGPETVSQFTHTPGQIAFSPSGSQLIVTTKANGDDIDVFFVSRSGLISLSPVVNPEPTAVPFAVTFDAQGHLVVAEASGFVATFALSPNGTVSLIDSVPTDQVATCWIAQAQGFFYASNAGSASLSDLSESSNAHLVLLGDTPTDPGAVDAAASPDGQFLYVQTGAEGIVDEFHVNQNGSLTKIGSVTVPNAAGGEGIVVL